MSRFIMLRIIQGLLTLVLVSVLTFFLINLAPGGPRAVMNFESSAEQREALTKQLGLDKPVIQRYLVWLGDVVQGDLGKSLDSQQPVAALLKERFPNTVILALSTLIFTLLIGIPVGVYAAMKRGRWMDRLVTFISTFGMAIPEFWLGILLIIIFSVIYQVLPASGMITSGSDFAWGDLLKHMILPVLTLSILILPNIIRFTRSAMVDVIELDYIRTARAKGLGVFRVFFKHALHNALVPIAAIIGLIIPILLGGTVVVENVFGWPGMGRLAVQAATNRDYTLVMGITMLIGAIVIITNMLTDIMYTFLDPRIRYE
ncbi:peptide/nickel transport system permease protein [Paenibacillus sp. yr247]|uniref:ABC transporter permease n=1 Tax=Paenibacillus sp. yr247 TaxID=1761880 RepID=UPI0008861E22|nr:ABC transporter permease [Paenibacillus sp. yr247]SDO17116.1 peptide/nickel transport system permease protein [Paenibacillus sp. yr247]